MRLWQSFWRRKSKKTNKHKKRPTDVVINQADKPTWFVLAEGEIGTKEFSGRRNNPRVEEYHRATTLRRTDDSIPWCSSFVNWVMESKGYPSTRSARARSWEDWGAELKVPTVGCICVFWRGSKRSGKGHVGFYVGQKNGRLFILGGNQSDSVNISSYSKHRLLSYRWPHDKIS